MKLECVWYSIVRRDIECRHEHCTFEARDYLTIADQQFITTDKTFFELMCCFLCIVAEWFAVTVHLDCRKNMGNYESNSVPFTTYQS